MSCSISLVLLLGIPAAGKTTLAHLFEELVQKIPLKINSTANVHQNLKTKANVIHIDYDSLIEDNLRFDEENPTWKQYRRQVHSCVDQMLHCITEERIPLQEAVEKIVSNVDASEERNETVISGKFQDLLSQQISTANPDDLIVFILDDNFFYRSMRYEYFQLARKYSIGFCEVYISCPAAVASSRNSRRSKPVSDETYATMIEKIEEPCPIKAPWETDFIIVDGGSDFEHLELSEMWGLVTDSLQNPAQPLSEEDLVDKANNRAISLNNILHQADIILRKCVSESIRERNSRRGEESLHVKSWALKANSTRTTLLSKIREGALTLPPLYQDQSTAPESAESSTLNEAFVAEIRRLYGEAVST